MSQENLLLSIFPKKVAQAVQKELQLEGGTSTEKSLFRTLYVSRLNNVR